MRHVFLILIIMVILVPDGIAVADDEWTALDTSLEATFVVITVMDWRQTRDIHNHPDIYETNPILGKYPSTRKINTLIPLSIITHAVVATMLPKPYRTIWQSVWIGIELNAVNTNTSLGLSIHF